MRVSASKHNLLLLLVVPKTACSPTALCALQEILGTAQSVGCTVDGNHPHDLIEQINSGELPIAVRFVLFYFVC